MSDEIGCTVEFGGKIKRSDIDRLLAVMLEDGDLEEADERKRPCCTCGSTNYGQAPELVNLLTELGLAYRRTSDAKYEWDGEGEYWDGKTVDKDDCAVTIEFACRQDGSPYLVLGDLTKIAKEGAKIPPLEIVEDEQ
jgi:hypothetical protein